MFCYQCEQTARVDGVAGCATDKGNCGKDAQTSDLQDLLIHALKGVSQYNVLARSVGAGDNAATAFVMKGMFSTLTNVNFNPARFTQMIDEATTVRARVKAAYEAAAGANAQTVEGPGAWAIPTNPGDLLAQAEMAAVRAGEAEVGEDIVSLRSLILYGAKGVCAYAHHALMLGQEDDTVYAGIDASMDYLASNPTDIDALVGQALGLGTLNFKVMEMQDTGHKEKFGTPEPSQARTTPVAGKAILVSGHDMVDLEALLKQTEGTGVNVYTHGEMLPAHSYPALKKYDHLVANYAGAWQEQQTDFANFPGPVLMTSNCIIEPQASYRGRIFTTGPVGWPGLRHFEDHSDFSTLIQAAQALPGFTESGEDKSITVGFGHDAVLGVADVVIDAVKSGAIKHFFLVGGCDGADKDRTYYSDFVSQTPDDTVILTLGCAKYRFNDQDLGDIGGIPRLLDMGQCNDSYSAIQVASALAGAFECGVNDLPLSLNVSWFEQKAAAVLLTLLSLGIKDIYLGPTLPGFITPAVLGKLVEAFDLKPVSTPEADLAAMLQKAS